MELLFKLKASETFALCESVLNVLQEIVDMLEDFWPHLALVYQLRTRSGPYIYFADPFTDMYIYIYIII